MSWLGWTVAATCAALVLTWAGWRCYVLGVRHGVQAMYREAAALLMVETESAKLRSAGLIARIDTQIAMARALRGDHE